MTGNTLEQRATAKKMWIAALQEAGQTTRAAALIAGWQLDITDTIAISAIEAALRLSAGADWQPIETAPRTGKQEMMLLAWADGTVEQGVWLNNEKWQGFRPESLRFWPDGQPTHWQPLPAAPTLAYAVSSIHNVNDSNES